MLPYLSERMLNELIKESKTYINSNKKYNLGCCKWCKYKTGYPYFQCKLKEKFVNPTDTCTYFQDD